VKVPDLKTLMEVKVRAEEANLTVAVVRDAGLTEVPPGTITAVVIGPDEERKVDRVTGNLPLLK
jgi:PTH2 family peptidyl-tRNA hydrolase